MQSVEMVLTPAHWRAGMARFAAAVRSAARRSGAAPAGSFLLFAALGAFGVSAFRAVQRIEAGADGAAAAWFAVRTTLLATVLAAALALLWLTWREARLRRLLRRMEEAAERHFDGGTGVMLGWDERDLSWAGAEGTGGIALAALHAWEDEADGDGLILLYLAPFHFLPVPLDELRPGQADSLRSVLRQAGVADQWREPAPAPAGSGARGFG